MKDFIKDAGYLFLSIILILNTWSIALMFKQSEQINILKNQISILQGLNKQNETYTNTKLQIITKEIMTPSELAQYLNIDIQEVYKSIIENQSSNAPYFKVGDEYRFSKKAIDEWLKTAKQVK
ncbi:MAG: Helix-turn-helix domain [Clostridiaceae bacterium]|jgi:excisionase family DNA binding protein|nr:Helix-turn-helix domain [Clostridiaceae bacterium]